MTDPRPAPEVVLAAALNEINGVSGITADQITYPMTLEPIQTGTDRAKGTDHDA